MCVYLISWFLIFQLVQFPLAMGRFELSESSTLGVSPLLLTISCQRGMVSALRLLRKHGFQRGTPKAWDVIPTLLKKKKQQKTGNPMSIITQLGNQSFWSCVGIRYTHDWKHQFNSAGALQILQVALEIPANQAGTSNQGIPRLQENLYVDSTLHPKSACICCATDYNTSTTWLNYLKKKIVSVAVLNESQSSLAHSQAVKHPALLFAQWTLLHSK